MGVEMKARRLQVPPGVMLSNCVATKRGDEPPPNGIIELHASIKETAFIRHSLPSDSVDTQQPEHVTGKRRIGAFETRPLVWRK